LILTQASSFTISGSVRECLVNKHGIINPPNIGLSMPVDIRGINDESDFGVKYVLLTSPLPTNTEGKRYTLSNINLIIFW